MVIYCQKCFCREPLVNCVRLAKAKVLNTDTKRSILTYTNKESKQTSVCFPFSLTNKNTDKTPTPNKNGTWGLGQHTWNVYKKWEQLHQKKYLEEIKRLKPKETDYSSDYMSVLKLRVIYQGVNQKSKTKASEHEGLIFHHNAEVNTNADGGK